MLVCRRRSRIAMIDHMKYYFHAAAFGCLLQALSATFFQFFLAPLCDSFGYVCFTVYSFLVISWPLWGFVFWRLAKSGRARASATMAIGLLFFSPVIYLVLCFYLGYDLTCLDGA
jgi:hypothetical protein